MAIMIGLTRTSLFNLSRNSLVLSGQPSRHLKSALKIKWVRPEKPFCILPEVSGDLEPLGTVDMSQFPSSIKPAQELSNADKIVQKLHTLEFYPRNKLKEEFLTLYTNRVKAHRLDDDSPEVKIAKLTVTIRNLQIHVAKHRMDKLQKVRLKEIIDKRDKYMRQLRATDYKKFEWILDRLNIIHKVFGLGGSERVERKKSLRRLTALYMEKLKAERLAEYKTFLESKKEEFLQDKLEKLLWIKNTEIECGMVPTVSDSDLEDVRKKLEELRLVEQKAIA